jgi:hypothetical protein
MPNVDLEVFIRELEALGTRGAVRERMHEICRASGREPEFAPLAFVRTVARQYADDISHPLSASDYPGHWPRFKALWDRLE